MKITSIKIIIKNKYFIIKFSDSMDYIYFFFNLIHYIVILIYINLLNLWKKYYIMEYDLNIIYILININKPKYVLIYLFLYIINM